MYLKSNDLKRARKVCDIGFNYHENDISGWFVYAKIEKAEGNLKEVEKALEKVLFIQIITLQQQKCFVKCKQC